jgi:hypothetical protein
LLAAVLLNDLEGEVLELGEQGAELAGVVEQGLVFGELAGGEPSGHGLAADLAGPFGVGPVQARRVCVAAAARLGAGVGADAQGAGQGEARLRELGGDPVAGRALGRAWFHATHHLRSTGLTGAARRTLRTNLRFIGRRVVPQLYPADLPLPRERAKKPYSPAQIDGYFALADAQPAPQRRMRAVGLVCLGAGAGLIRADPAMATGEDDAPVPFRRCDRDRVVGAPRLPRLMADAGTPDRPRQVLAAAVAVRRNACPARTFASAIPHLQIRRLCRTHPLLAHSAADLPKRYSLMRSRRQR